MYIIHDELKKMGIECNSYAVLQDKDGATTVRISSSGASYVLKYFQRDAFKREILNYQLLSSLGIPTIQVISTTDSAILLEDIDRSADCRLGVQEDMADPEVARQLAVWYKQLHTCGRDYVAQHGAFMYDEADYFTLDNIAYIKERTGTQSALAWRLLEGSFDTISTMLHNTPRTLTYNDFYYTNLVVARDKSSALMFDYNLLGKGYIYADLRNVISSLSKNAGKAFLEAYGNFDPAEAVLDDVVSVVVTLYMACRRQKLPDWGQNLLNEIDTKFVRKIERICQE